MMMKTISTILAMTTLVGCGGAETSTGGGGTNTNIVPAATPSYALLSATTGGTSQIAGAALATNTNSGDVSAGGISGNLKHWNGTLKFTNGVATFTANGDGLQLGDVTHGNNGSTLLTAAQNGFGSGYQYLTVFQLHGAAGGNGTDALGVFGVPIQNSHMPNGGSASYSGEAEAMLVTQGGGTVLLTEGNAALTVNFGTGRGNLTLNQFSSQNADGTSLSNGPVSSIKVVAMNISGTSMSGGTLTFNGNTSPSSLLGDGTSVDTQSQFFGFENGRPAEVGGVISAGGDLGALSAIYVVD